MAILSTAEKALPAGLRAKISPLGDKIVSARDEVARAQRMALVAFAVRIVSAGIAFISQIILAPALWASSNMASSPSCGFW